MKISLNWLREFVDLPESASELNALLDDLGLVVEGVSHVGAGLEDVVVARVDEIRAIEGASRVRLVVVDAGSGPLEIVCGATNFAVGDHVPLARVGAVLPGGLVIAERTMRGVTSRGMLCSPSELGLSDDHRGLMVLDGLIEPRVGEGLQTALKLIPDVIFDIAVEGNRPDAWSVEGVARDLATRLRRPLRAPALATPDSETASSSFASASIEDPELCGRLTVSVLRHVRVGPSPSWIAHRLQNAGMRPISNVVDASNLVMLELGQPTHPYDASLVARRTLTARRARPGETLTTLDGVERTLAVSGRGLGDTGEDCVIVDGDDHVLGLAGIMGGASSEIGDGTTEVLLEAAFFDPMVIARSAKRHGLRSEASNRFERGVDPHLALRAAARFVAVLRESVPDVEWLADPLDVWGVIPTPPTIQLRENDVERLLGFRVPGDDVEQILRGLDFVVSAGEDAVSVTAPSRRLDVRRGAPGRADVIEEIARLYGYGRLPRHYPAWHEVGALSERQKLRRRLRDVVTDVGAFEAWTPTLGSDADFDLVHSDGARVRVANPLSLDETVLRATLVTGLVRAWAKNFDRGLGDVVLAEFGVVFLHPGVSGDSRVTRGGIGGELSLELPRENERLSVVLARKDDDATSAVGLWKVIEQRLGLKDVVVRSLANAPRILHPTRAAELVDRGSGALVGFVGEVDPSLVDAVTSAPVTRRLGLLDLDLDVLFDVDLVARRPLVRKAPSRYPSAVLDLAFVTPGEMGAADLAHALSQLDELVESVSLFDVYQGPGVRDGSRSLAFNVRLSAFDRTLSEKEVSDLRAKLIECARVLGAVLR